MSKRQFLAALAAYLAAISLLGGCLHDSWLRPWPTVLRMCAVSMLVGFAVLWLLRLRRFVAALISLGLAIFAALIVIPQPSAPHLMRVSNLTPASVQIRLISENGSRYKQARITPGGNWSFTYYSEGENPSTPIRAVLEATNLSSGSTVKREVDLPVRSAGFEIPITVDWFREKE